jgi:hypothetical protein
MPMMIVNDQEFEKELEKLNPTPETAEVKDIERGRGKGSTEVPDSLRKVIGENAILEGNGPTREAFGLSQSSISAYKNGATSTATYNEPNAGLKEHTDIVKEQISAHAKHKLLRALENITDDKLNGASLKTISGLARDMSAVVKNIEPQTITPGTGVQFVFYSPKLRQESDYDVIAISDR